MLRWQMARRIVPAFASEVIDPARGSYLQPHVKRAPFAALSFWWRASNYVLRYHRKIVPAVSSEGSECTSGEVAQRGSKKWRGARMSALRTSRTGSGAVHDNELQYEPSEFGDAAVPKMLSRTNTAKVGQHQVTTLAQAKQHQGWHGTQYLGVYRDGILESAKDVKSRKQCRTMPEITKQVDRLWQATTKVQLSSSHPLHATFGSRDSKQPC